MTPEVLELFREAFAEQARQLRWFTFSGLAILTVVSFHISIACWALWRIGAAVTEAIQYLTRDDR